jgi:uncharacterized protein
LEVGNQVKFSSIGSDLGKSEKTVANWFQLLEDTLIGKLLPCFSKTPEGGVAFENFTYTHLKAFCDYTEGRELFYWRTTDKTEVDFIITKNNVPEYAIEVKCTSKPKKEHFEGLIAFGEEYPKCEKFLVCFVEKPEITAEGVKILPAEDFLKNLFF